MVAQKSKLLSQYNSLLFLSHPVYVVICRQCILLLRLLLCGSHTSIIHFLHTADTDIASTGSSKI